MDQLTNEQIAEFKEVFSIFDADNDGLVSTSEFGTIIRSLGLNPTQKEMEDFNNASNTANGKVTFPEFLALVASKLQDVQQPAEELLDAFRVFDTDEDGFISTAELRHAMTKLGEKLSDEEVDVMIKLVDSDGDGKLNYGEFVSILTRI